MDPFARDRLSLIAAFGAGIALSASVAGLYSKFKSKNSKNSVRKKIDCLAETIEQLKRDVEEIKVASLRGSPYSLRPIDKWDIDRLENITESEADMTVDGQNPNNRYGGSSESMNRDTSDDNEEFYDFTDG